MKPPVKKHKKYAFHHIKLLIFCKKNLGVWLIDGQKKGPI